MSERRTDRFLDANRNHGLNAFLADDPGVDSGHMIAQYTQAGIVSELKRLAAPASVDSIPSSAMQEDHVSMGWSAARKLRRSIDGLSRVLAIELLTSARAMDLRAPVSRRRCPPPSGRRLRRDVEGPGTDRYLAPEIAAAHRLVLDGSLLAAAASVVSQQEENCYEHDQRTTARARLPRHAPATPSAGRRRPRCGCCRTTSTRRSPSTRTSSSSTAAPARPPATGRASTRSCAR